jgi:hypothetical protein
VGQATGGAAATSSGINLHQTQHRPRMSLLYGQAGGGGSRTLVPPQERWAFPSQAQRRLAEVGAAEPGTQAWQAAVREAVYATREGAGPGEAEAVDWTDLLMNSTHPQARRSALRRTALFPAFFLVFAFAGRRRTAPRFHPTPNEMNVKRGFKPTAEKTRNRRKT